MQRGLEGRRIALFARAEQDRIRRQLEQAGALVETLSDGRPRPEADWHAGRYAAVVVGAATDPEVDRCIEQLLRESLLVEKPIVVVGDGMKHLERAGGSRDDVLVADVQGDDVVRLLADRLDERELDRMSDLSFPASDPPAVTPSTIGPDGPLENDSEAR